MTSSAKATFSCTVLFGSSRKSWNTVPIWRRSCGTFQFESRAMSLPVDVHLARRGALLAQDQPQQGGLARPGGADEEDELALVDLQASHDPRQGGPDWGRPW